MPLAQSSVRSGSPQFVTATISNGTSLSAGVNVDGKLCGIYLPSAWTAAAMTFQASSDGVTYVDVWDTATGTGAERTIASGNIATAAGRFYPLSLNDNLAVNFIKVRSGTSGVPVNQGADRVVTLALAG